MKVEIRLNGIHLTPETPLDNEVLKSWDGETFRTQFTTHCYPQGPGEFPFLTRGQSVLSGSLYKIEQ